MRSGISARSSVMPVEETQRTDRLIECRPGYVLQHQKNFDRTMIDNMNLSELSPATQRSYLLAVAKFSRYFGRMYGDDAAAPRNAAAA